MIHGLSHLLTMRRNKQRPESLWVSCGIDYRKPIYADDFKRLELVAEGSLKLDDFRPFFGLDVTLFSVHDEQPFGELIEKMKGYANRLMILSCDYGTDLGMEWSREWGTTDIGELHWAYQFDDARTSVCRTTHETKERIRLEQEALQAAPWIPTRRNDGTRLAA